MTSILGLIFSARSGGNLYDLAQQLFTGLSTALPEVETELVEIAQHKVNPCNGCSYDCLFGQPPHCPIEDDVLRLWRSVLRSDLVVYFVPTYGGMPPATWVAFQQRYHGVVCHVPKLVQNPQGKVAALTVYEPRGTKTGDISQQVILKNLVGQPRPLISFEQIVPTNYGLNSLGDRLVLHQGIRERLATMGHRIIAELQAARST